MFFFGNWNIQEQSLCEADTNKHNQAHRFLMDMLLLPMISKNNLFCYLVDVSKFECLREMNYIECYIFRMQILVEWCRVSDKSGAVILE